MSKMDSVKRVRVEDFPKDSRETIQALAPILNSFMEQVVNIFDGNVDYENLRKDLVTVDVTTIDGVPTELTRVKFDLTGKAVGTDVIRAQNLSNTGEFPIAQPFITFVTTGNLMTIRHISGLQNNVKYRLTVEIKGE